MGYRENKSTQNKLNFPVRENKSTQTMIKFTSRKINPREN